MTTLNRIHSSTGLGNFMTSYAE